MSKKRKRSTGHPARQSAPAPFAHGTPTVNTGQLRERFVDLACREGHPFPAVKGYEPVGPARECWTNAWNYARATGLGYAEGVAKMPNGWHAHAWCVTEDGAVVEPTVGYDHATEYRGWCIDMRVAAAITAAWDGPRSSFLEAGIGSGAASWEEIRDRCTYIPGTV